MADELMGLEVRMGEIVTVHWELERTWPQYPGLEDEDFDPSKPAGWRTWKPVERAKPRAGWVVGMRRLQSGFRRQLAGFDEAPEWRQVGGTIPCILVVYWPTMRPVPVPLDGFGPGGEPEAPAYQWTTQDRENMRDCMRDFPRDERGRFRALSEPEVADGGA